ncbi:MAG: VWA domain-containing protein [Planctomycetota bacterium]|nr:VWA domain-containing protein [Planctomycetota bacterium]
MTFHHPSVWFLLLLLILPLLWWRWSGGRRRAAVTFSSLAPVEAIRPSWAVRLRWLVHALRSVVLIGLIVVLARPQRADERTRIFTEGIAIQLVVDRSGSMRAMDFRIDGRRVTRMEAVRDVIRDFIEGGEDLPGRPDDLIGLITFASWADSLCPLTLDHAHLADAVAQTDIASEQEGRETAIGDAIALGVERMQGLEQRPDLHAGPAIKSRVMILLTDGEHNAGDIDPLTAAEMAAAFDIRIYTIGAGTDRASAPIMVTDPFTGRDVMRHVRVSIDEETLKRIADLTGGQYFRATDENSLRGIYARIDELERTEIEQRKYTRYKELSVEPVRLGGFPVPPLVIVVLVVLALEVLLANTRFRTLP